MFVRLLLLATLLALSIFGQSPQLAPVPASGEQPGSGSGEAVRIIAYGENGRVLSQSWAIPVRAGYLAVRSAVAQAHRVELLYGVDRQEPVEAVGGEDVEGNLVLLHGPEAPSSILPLVDATPDLPAKLAIHCAGASIPVNQLKARDIPVFGLVWVGETKHRESVSGCPAFDEDDRWLGIVTWDNPFGKPSVAIIPSARAKSLAAAERQPWEEWHSAQLYPEKRLRDSLLSEALQDLWREDYRTAAATLSYLIENEIENARPWYYRGFAKAMQGKRKEAMVDYEHAVHRAPQNAEMRFSLGLSHAMLLNIQEAEKQLVALESLDQKLALRLRVIVDSLRASDHPHPQHSDSDRVPPDSETSSPDEGPATPLEERF